MFHLLCLALYSTKNCSYHNRPVEIHTIVYTLQFSLDTTCLKECLAKLFNISEDEVRLHNLNRYNIKMGEEKNVCNPTGKTSHFPEVLDL